MHNHLFDTPRKRYAFFAMLSAFVGFIGGGCLLAILLSNNSYYFRDGAAVALTILMFSVTTASFVLSLVYRRTAPASNAVFRGHLTALVFHVCFMVTTCIFGGYHIVMGILAVRNTLLPGICLIFSGVFALAGLRFSVHSMKKDVLRVVLSGTSLSLSCLFYTFYLYFDSATPKNTSMKQLLVLASLALALFFLSEIRRVLGKKSGVFYHFIIAAALQLCGILTVTPLVMKTQGYSYIAGDIPTYIFFLLLFFYIFIWTIVPHFWLSGQETEFPAPVSMTSNSVSDTTSDTTTTGGTEE